MTERPSDGEPGAMPRNIATLYSRAHTQGTSYWDFSASRKEVKGQFRHRMVSEPAEAPQLPPIPLESPARKGPVRVSEGGPQAQEQPKPEPAKRWYALRSVFASKEPAAPPLAVAASLETASLHPQPPMAAVLSLAGGVGKTCLVATLGRALSARGERVLLVDTASGGMLPFYFGSRERKPGVVRTFSPPRHAPPLTAGGSDAPVDVLNLEAERYPGVGNEQDELLGELVRGGRGASRILVDLATASREVTRRVLLLQPAVLVPILPDMSSVASLGLLETLLANPVNPLHPVQGQSEIFYLLNQFDASLPLHLDVREMLQRKLGDRLLPLVVRRSPAVSEALAEGMTVIDYAPDSAAAEDYGNLADWLRRFAAPAVVGRSGVRWSER